MKCLIFPRYVSPTDGAHTFQECYHDNNALSTILSTQSIQEGSAAIKWWWNIHVTNAATCKWINTTFMLATIIQTCKFFDDCSIFSLQQAVLTHSAIVNSSCPSTVQTPANTEVISAVMGWEHLISHNSTKIWSTPTEILNVHHVHHWMHTTSHRKHMFPIILHCTCNCESPIISCHASLDRTNGV